VLGHLISCAPPQLPSPYDSGAAAAVIKITNPNGSTTAVTLQSYVDTLTGLHNLDSVTRLYPQSATATAHTNGTATQPQPLTIGDWRSIPAETQTWEAVQASLDIFVQRISVAEGAQKSKMRGWYESLQELGGHYFGNA
jgi:hypothetical protein